MNEDDKRLFDSLKSAADFWWERFDKRVTYNWKVSLSLWGVLVAYIGIVMRGDLTFSNSFWFTAITIFIGLAIACAHISYIVGSTRAHRIDRLHFNEYEQRYMKIIDLKYGDELKTLIEDAKEEQTSLKHWANSFLWIITFLLVVIAILVTLVTSNQGRNWQNPC